MDNEAVYSLLGHDLAEAFGYTSMEIFSRGGQYGELFTHYRERGETKITYNTRAKDPKCM